MGCATITGCSPNRNSGCGDVVDSSGARWFASVDLADVGGSSRRLAALGAAAEAHEAGLSFVVAPLRTVADDVAVHRLVEAAGPQADRMVLTHGEPHPGNLLRTEDGLRLIDWDTALLAPPERDLWLVETLRGAPEKTEDTGWSWDALEATVNDLAGRYA